MPKLSYRNKERIGGLSCYALWYAFQYLDCGTREEFELLSAEEVIEALRSKKNLADLRQKKGFGPVTINKISILINGKPLPPERITKRKKLRLFGREYYITISYKPKK